MNKTILSGTLMEDSFFSSIEGRKAVATRNNIIEFDEVESNWKVNKYQEDIDEALLSCAINDHSILVIEKESISKRKDQEEGVKKSWSFYAVDFDQKKVQDPDFNQFKLSSDLKKTDIKKIWHLENVGKDMVLLTGCVRKSAKMYIGSVSIESRTISWRNIDVPKGRLGEKQTILKMKDKIVFLGGRKENGKTFFVNCISSE